MLCSSFETQSSTVISQTDLCDKAGKPEPVYSTDLQQKEKKTTPIFPVWTKYFNRWKCCDFNN